jgi:hypothetical protein
MNVRLLTRPAIATWAAFILRALPLVALPVLIAPREAPAFLAFWLVLITLQGLQLLFESSLTASFMRSFSYAMGGADRLRIDVGPPMQTSRPPNHKLLARTWNTGAVIYAGMAVVTAAVVIVAGGMSAQGIAEDLGPGADPWLALLVFAAGAGLRAYSGLHLSYLYGVERITLARWWEATFWALAFTTASGAVLAGGGLLGIALAYQIPIAANIFWNMWLCRKDQQARPGFTRRLGADRDIIAQLWPSIWRTGVGTILYLGTTQGIGLYYATIGQPAQVAAFLFAMSIIRPLGQFAQVPFFTKVPVLARLQALGETQAQQAIAERGMRYSYILHAGIVLAVATLLPLLGSMQDGELHVPLLLWLLMGLAGYLERIGGMHLQLYSSTNHILVHWANGVTAIAFIAFAAVLFPSFGVSAFPLAQGIALLVAFLPISMVNSYRAYALPIPSFELKTSAVPLMVLLIAIAGTMV